MGIVLNIIVQSGVRYTTDGSTAGPGTMIGGILAVIILLVFSLLGPDPRGQQYDQPTAWPTGETVRVRRYSRDVS